MSIFLIFSGIVPVNSASIDNERESSNIPISPDYLQKRPKTDYIIGPGDELNIIVSRFYPELTTVARVDGEGTILLPKLNRIFVRDLSINELTQVLNEAYKKFVKFPELEVEILRYRPIRVFVEGEVENPGMQILEGSFSLNSLNSKEKNIPSNISAQNRSEIENFYPTVFDAIRSSGGITEFTDLSQVQIIRKNKISQGGGKITANLNFEKVILKGDISQNIRIYDEDIIKVKKGDKSNNFILQKSILSRLNPKFVEVFVSGRVNYPGKIIASKTLALNDAISLAGGAKALKGKISFLRIQNNGTLEKRKFRFDKSALRGSSRNPYLKRNDLIIVGSSPLSISTEIINEFTSPFMGIFSTYSIFKVLGE